MAIVKRLTPKQKFIAKHGDTWQRILSAPLVAAMCNPYYHFHVPADLTSLVELVSKFYDKNWMTKVSWNEKIFLYAAGMVARRAGVPGLLPDEHMAMLARHMNAASTIHKVDKNEVPVYLGQRMALIWGIPEFLNRYKTAGSYTLPPATPPRKPKPDAYLFMTAAQRAAYDAAQAAKKKRVKLAKHRK